MHHNTLKPAAGAKQNRKRLGRGIGSGLGKTCGKGHKGQTARSGYSAKVGFEGGQMPLQRRLPKFGFTSAIAKYNAEVRLGCLAKVKKDRIGVAELKEADLIRNDVSRVKVILAGKLERPVTIYGLKITAGARRALEALGGKVE